MPVGKALNELLALGDDEKRKRGILHTPSEIAGQVGLWESTFKTVERNLESIRGFIGAFLENEKRQLLCTGAGTSEFAGLCVEGLLRKRLMTPVNVVSSTKIVTNPQDVFIEGYSTLLLSFARSGNSPESVGAVEIAEKYSAMNTHLIVTCNASGALKRWADAHGVDAQGADAQGADSLGFDAHGVAAQGVFALCLDERTDDKGLAMTASFSNMVLAAQLIADAFSFGRSEARVAEQIEAGKNVLETAPDVIKEVCDAEFDRAVFLGNGVLFGTAVESHLKLQELTAGRVMCAFDTFPGLRHGPEAVIDDRTLVVCYLSRDPYCRKYEEDLLRELREKKLGMLTLAFADRVSGPLRKLVDRTVEYDLGGRLGFGDDYAPPVAVIVGQLLGLFKSTALGFKPDAPSEAGVIHRVVEGVRVYDPVEHRRSGSFRTIAG
jgi:tagatose-6-phosphate ketose/aldose isomerase